jgi:type II secretory pathway pseudopilin PulG
MDPTVRMAAEMTSAATTPNKLSCPIRLRRGGGFVLAEIVMVVLIISLLVALVMFNTQSMLGRNVARTQAQYLVDAMNSAGMAAAQSDRRYEVVVDISYNGFLLREISSGNLEDILQEEVIQERLFNKDVRVKYVKYDDMANDVATEGQARFRAGHAGWQFGGKIVFVDNSGDAYSIVINRLNRTVAIVNGDVDFLQPQDDVPF